MASHRAAARLTAVIAASLPPCEAALICCCTSARRAPGLRTHSSDGSGEGYAETTTAAQYEGRPRRRLRNITQALPDFCSRRPSYDRPRPRLRLGPPSVAESAFSCRRTYPLSDHRGYSTTPAEGSTSAADPRRSLTASERAYWTDRTLQKRKAATYNVILAARGGGPGWLEHLRKCHLDLAEKELEEQSWSIPSGNDDDGQSKDTTLPPPVESQVAGLCYLRSIEALRARKELMGCAHLLEDWLHFYARLPTETKRTSTPVSLKLLYDCVVAVSLHTFDATSSARTDSKVWLEALGKLRAASLSVQVHWTTGMYSSAAKAYIRSDMLADGLLLLSELLKEAWAKKRSLGAEGSTNIDSAAQTKRDFADETNPTAASARLINTLGHQLAGRRRRIHAVLSGYSNKGRNGDQLASEALLLDYIAASVHIGRLFREGYLPLEDSQEAPSPRTLAASQVPGAGQEQRATDRLIAEIAKVSDVYAQMALLPLQFAPEDRQAIGEQEGDLRSSLAFCVRSAFDAPNVSGSGKAPEPQLPPEDQRLNMARSAFLSTTAMNTLLRFSLRWMADTQAALKILAQWAKQESSTSDGDEASKVARRQARVRLTTLLNEAVRLQDRGFERAALDAMCQIEGVKPPQDVHPDSPAKAILGVQILGLLRVAAAREAHHTICVLLRCLVAGGYLRNARAQSSSSETEEPTEVRTAQPLPFVSATQAVQAVDLWHSRHNPIKTLKPKQRRLLLNPWVGSNLLNLAAKSGSYNLTLDLWYSIKNVRDRDAAAAQSGEPLAHGEGESQGMSLVEATCFYHALGDLSRAHAKSDRSRKATRSQGGLERDPRSIASWVETAVTLMLDIREHAETTYGELTAEWAKLHAPPLLDARFYDHLLSASGWSSVISILRWLEEGTPWPRSAEETRRIVRDQAGGDSPGFFESARAFFSAPGRESAPPLSAWHPRQGLSVAEQARAQIAFAFVRGQREVRAPPDLATAAVAAYEHIEARPACLSSLLRILSDMAHLGVPIPPAYRFFLLRFPALRHDARVRHILDGAGEGAAESEFPEEAPETDPRKRRLHEAGLRLRVPKTRGRVLSVEDIAERDRAKRVEADAEREAAEGRRKEAEREVASREAAEAKVKARKKKGRVESGGE